MNSPYDQYNQMYPNGGGGATQVPVFQDANAANLMDNQVTMPSGGKSMDMSSLAKLGSSLRNYTNKKGYTDGKYTGDNGLVVDPSQGSFNPASVNSSFNNSYPPSGMMGGAVTPSDYQPTNFAPTLMGGQ